MHIGRIHFGQWLKHKRLERKLSQGQVALKLGLSGKGHVSQWEQGNASVPIERLFDISILYRVPMSELLERLEEWEPKIHQKFVELDEKFKKRYDMQFEIFRGGNNMANIQGAEIALHHRELFMGMPGETSDNVTYVNHRTLFNKLRSMYIM